MAESDVSARIQRVEEQLKAIERAHSSLSNESSKLSEAVSHAVHVATACKQNHAHDMERLARRVQTAESNSSNAYAVSQKLVNLPRAVDTVSEEVQQGVSNIRLEVATLQNDMQSVFHEQKQQRQLLSSLLEQVDRLCTSYGDNGGNGATMSAAGTDFAPVYTEQAVQTDTSSACVNCATSHKEPALHERPSKPTARGKAVAAKAEALAAQQEHIASMTQSTL